jgi:hypothetical protein
MLGENGRQPALLTFLERETEGNTFLSSKWCGLWPKP